MRVQSPRFSGWVAFLLVLPAVAARDVALSPNTTIHFANAAEAAEAIGKSDAFIEALSPFDRAARKQSGEPVGTDELLRFISAQALAWSIEEEKKFAPIIGSVSNKLARFARNVPSRILLVKTTGREEGEAAYCRNADVIVVPRSKTDDPSAELEDLLIHELFHIWSRNNRAKRDALYAIVGFKPCPEVALPDSIRPRKITNPDAPRIEHYIEVTIRGTTLPVAPVLFSKQDRYDPESGRSFFDYLTFKLLAVEKRGERWTPRTREGEPWLLDVSEAGDFHDQIGRNTGYIIHPEELLADNFVLLANGKRDLPSPQIIERMRAVLTQR